MAVTRLNAAQLKRLNAAILALYEEATDASPLKAMLGELTRLMPATWWSADEAFPATGLLAHRIGRNLECVPNVVEKIAIHGLENPMVAYTQREGFAPALRISDFVTFRQFQQTGYYAEIARYFTGWRDQTAVVLRLPESFLGFTLNRESQFTDEERLILELLQPHLERVLYRSTQYARLPAHPPLTPREREVLHWVAEGKRDAEIAVILRLSARTVSQHVRAILAKLGVETRTGALAAAWRARMSTPPLDATAPPRKSAR